MTSEARKRYGYPFGKIRVYWSATIIVLSVILAILMLRELVSLFMYVIFTVLLAVAVLALKMRFLRVSMAEPSDEELFETESGGQTLKSLLIMVVVLIAIISVPLLLGRFWPELWFVSLISYTSSVSVAEVLFFLITRDG